MYHKLRYLWYLFVNFICKNLPNVYKDINIAKLNPELFYLKIESKLRTDNCSDSTIRLYLSGVKRFVVFTKKQDATEINNTDLLNFSKSLFKNKRLKFGTIRPIKFGISYGFNKVLNLGLDIDLIPSLKSVNIEKEFFSKKEIATFFTNIQNLKHRTIFQLMYGLGVEVTEIMNIKITDIDSKNKIIIIRNADGKNTREAYLPASLLELLRNYFVAFKPKIYLFEGQKKGKPLSLRNIQNSFKINLDKLNINKNLSTRSLKHSYVKHLTEDGIPLNSILLQLNNTSSQTLKLYNDICFPIIKYNSSPFDTIKIENEDISFFDTTDLEYIMEKVTDREEKDYLLEGLKCFKANALRAGVIFLWSAAAYKIQKKCMNIGVNLINTELQIINKGAKKITVLEDFEYVKDSNLLDLACRLKIIDKHKKDELKNTCLDLRNKCGHPGNYKPKEQKIKAFVEDIIGMLY
jgi:integrase